MDMWIDIIEVNTAAVFCCGIAFMVNTDTNPRGLSVLLKNLITTTGRVTVHIRNLQQKPLTCAFTFRNNKYYHVFQEGSLLPYLISLVANSNQGLTWDVPTNWTHISTSALWLYTPKPTITRFQNPNIRYSYIIVNSDTSVLAFNEKERKVDTYTPNTIQGILLTGLHLKTYLETTYNDTHSE